MNRHFFRFIHYPLLHRDIQIQSYPWGWISQEHIHKMVLKPTLSDTPYCTERFEEGAIQAYTTVFKNFVNKEDFTQKNYTTPALSLVLNDIHQNIDTTQLLIPKIQQVKIIKSWVEPGISPANNKILGMWSPKEAKEEFLTGMLGPETTVFPSHDRVFVQVYYKSDNRRDVWVFESDIREICWKVNNMNGIIL
jgi:hypothetical protein